MASRYLPPEWAPQDAVLLTWPHAHTDWEPLLDSVEPVYVQITREIAKRQRVIIVCADDAHRAHIADLLLHADVDLNAVNLYVAPSNDTWARDHGPITVMHNDKAEIMDFTFNGWGGKYPADLDNRITNELHHLGAFGDTPLVRESLVLEGGSIETDGAGSLMTTTQCLLSGTRNPTLDKLKTEERLKQCFGVKHILWLEHGHLEGDDTDSHIDTLARFCDENTIAYVSCDDASDPHYPELQNMAAELRLLCNARGERYRLVALPWPMEKKDSDGRRLPATYANFLIINGAVLVPVYDDPADTIACDRLAEIFPDREIVPVPCLPLIRQNGSLHCISMQIPKGVLTKG